MSLTRDHVAIAFFVDSLCKKDPPNIILLFDFVFLFYLSNVKPEMSKASFSLTENNCTVPP